RARAGCGGVAACTPRGAAGPARIARLQALVAAEAQRLRGRDLPSSAEQALAAFDGPARAIRCARAIADEAARQGLSVGVGLHTGEWDTLRAAGEGPVAIAAARIAALAPPGGVLVSRTVVDLVGGSGFQFSETAVRETAAHDVARPLFAVR